MSVPPSCWVRNFLELSGMLAPSGFKYPLLYKVFMAYSMAASFYCIFGSIAYFFVVEGTSLEKLQSVQISLTVFSGFLKLCNAGCQQGKVKALLKNYDSLWDQLYEYSQNRGIMRKTEERCSKLKKIYGYFIVIIPLLSGGMPLLVYLFMGTEELAFQIFMPWEGNKYFILTQLTQELLTISPFLANSSSFFLYLTLSDQLATYMKIVRRMLREERVSRETIRTHQETIKLVHNTNELFSWLLYFETSTISIECSTSAYFLYKIHIKGGKRENIIPSIISFLFCYFIPYIICYCGNKITTESELLFRDAFNGQWYDHDLQSQKNLKILMLGASKTLHLHYKNMAVFGMELFLSIVNLTYKFLNVILWLE